MTVARYGVNVGSPPDLTVAGVDVNGPKLPFVEEASALSACVGTRCRVVRGALCPPIALFGVGTGGKQGPVLAGRGGHTHVASVKSVECHPCVGRLWAEGQTARASMAKGVV